MAKEKLWAMGNRVPSEFVTELELARRKAEQHRKATPEAWEDYVALRKLVTEAVGKLLVLEDERADFTRRLTIDPPPADMKPEDADRLCQDAVGGTLGHISSVASESTIFETQAPRGYTEQNSAILQRYQENSPDHQNLFWTQSCA